MIAFLTLASLLGLFGFLLRLGIRANARTGHAPQRPPRAVTTRRRILSAVRLDAHRKDPVTTTTIGVALVAAIGVAALVGGWQMALMETAVAVVCIAPPLLLRLAARRAVRRALARSPIADDSDMFVPEAWVKKYRSANDT
ncbi:MAG: hypothetical protein U0R80_00655 [Nocardioidaceae bacterium]